ncbi:MAG: hypothetical protein M3N31_06625 [Actinomycetota bacterium]|nr:hypothetical protein [Actinomycetota bacterium]
MSRRWLLLILPVTAVVVAAALVSRGPGGTEKEADDGQERFQFALIGDARYRPEEDAKFARVMDAINAEDMAFTVHIGDIKRGAAPCGDDVYLTTRRLFSEFSSPLIYTPGDNEWTDCGDRDPKERLAFLRRVFFPDDQSHGRRRLGVERHSAEYPENVRWRYGKVTFATLHVVGSNNNLPDPSTPGRPRGDPAEFSARNRANLEWLSQAFRKARADRSVAVVLAMQADPAFERPPQNRFGYQNLLAALERETVAFAKPVVLLHGDTHVSRVDKPMTDSRTGRTVENFTRVESFGSPDIHWVRGSVDTGNPEVFTFRQELIEANRAP